MGRIEETRRVIRELGNLSKIVDLNNSRVTTFHYY